MVLLTMSRWLAYLCTFAGMAWCVVQDLKTSRVMIPPLMLWVAGSAVYAYFNQIGYGIIIALVYSFLLRPYMHFADTLAMCCASLWFEIRQMPLFFAFIGIVSLVLHRFYRSRGIPMMPGIAVGWTVTHFSGFFSSIFFASVIVVMDLVSKLSLRIVESCQSFL